MKQPNVWNPDEWEVVYQDVGVAYEVRDHKDVYYDSGSNRNKWHKMMYYLLLLRRIVLVYMNLI